MTGIIPPHPLFRHAPKSIICQTSDNLSQGGRSKIEKSQRGFVIKDEAKAKYCKVGMQRSKTFAYRGFESNNYT